MVAPLYLVGCRLSLAFHASWRRVRKCPRNVETPAARGRSEVADLLSVDWSTGESRSRCGCIATLLVPGDATVAPGAPGTGKLVAETLGPQDNDRGLHGCCGSAVKLMSEPIISRSSTMSNRSLTTLQIPKRGPTALSSMPRRTQRAQFPRVGSPRPLASRLIG